LVLQILRGEKALSLGEDAEQIEKWLVELEESKGRLEIPSEENKEASKIVSVYGLSLFRKANEELNQGIRSKTLGRMFKAAADVLEVLKVFEGEVDESLNKVMLFSKQQAAQLLAVSAEESERENPKEREAETPIEKEKEFQIEQQTKKESERLIGQRVQPTPSHRAQQQIDGSKGQIDLHVQLQAQSLTEKQLFTQAEKINSTAQSTFNPASLGEQKKIAEAQKYARYATSALQFDDIETAKSNLRSALSLLESL
jgi:vacuolar protein sorting-associated protein VTA1